MARLKLIVPIILLLLSPSPVVPSAAFLGLFEELMMSWASNQGANNNAVVDSMNEQFDRMSDQIGTLEDRIDNNYQDIIEKLDTLAENVVFLLDIKTLSSKYRLMKKTYTELMEYFLAVKHGTINVTNIPRRDLPSTEALKVSWDVVHELVKTKEFFTKLSFNWKQRYEQQWKGPCTTYMSELQIRYALVLEYLSFIINYSNSRLILYSLDQKLDHADYSWAKGRFVKNLDSSMKGDWKYLKKLLTDASREYMNCDQPKNPEEPWYQELQAYTTYYTSRENIEDVCSADSEICPDITLDTCKAQYDDHLCSKTRLCSGLLQSCKISQGMNMCIKDDDNHLNSTTYRRYTTVAREYDYRGKPCIRSIATLRYSSIVYENSMEMSGRDRYRRMIFYNCICNEKKYYISTFPVIASRDYIIVGVQLKLHGDTLYFEVLEGKLEPGGTISDERDALQLKDEPEWLNHRVEIDLNTKIDLSPTKVPENENRVVTGIQFAKTDDYIHIVIHSKSISKKTATFESNTAQILKKTTFGTDEFKLSDIERSDKYSDENTPISTEKQFVKFNVTGLLEDGGQSTVPFIDTQLVLPEIHEPLSGISLYIRGQTGYGGFLALKIYTFDVSTYIETNTSYSDAIRRLQDLHRLPE